MGIKMYLQNIQEQMYIVKPQLVASAGTFQIRHDLLFRLAA